MDDFLFLLGAAICLLQGSNAATMFLTLVISGAKAVCLHLLSFGIGGVKKSFAILLTKDYDAQDNCLLCLLLKLA